MLIRKAYKFRLKTKSHHEVKLKQFAGCCRFVWNKALAIQKERLDNKQSCLSYNKMSKLLNQWKHKNETLFLRDVHSQVLQQTLMNLDRAIKDAFDKTISKQFPKFKKKGMNDSFRYPQGFKVNNNVAYLPKIGWIPFFKSRDIVGTLKNLTVSKKGKHWYVSIQTDIEIVEPVHPSNSSVGIDMGIARFATLSDGTYYEPLNSFRAMEKKLAREQRALSRKVKFSSNWYKQRDVISRLHIRIAAARNDYLHKISTAISKNHALVVIEDLKVSNMSASVKGTIEYPGRNVRQKAGLNKSILDQGWSEFRRQMDYKLLWRGGALITVPPHHTSQECPVCHFVSPDNRKSQSIFRCVNCGYTENADLVGAINIKAAGHAVLACGECGAARPLSEAGTS